MTPDDLTRGKWLWSRADGGAEQEKAEWLRWCDDNAKALLSVAERTAKLEEPTHIHADGGKYRVLSRTALLKTDEGWKGHYVCYCDPETGECYFRKPEDFDARFKPIK